jgi:small-conductance mechanosensitive channel
MVFPMLMTLGLAGSALVVFDLVTKTLVSMAARDRDAGGEGDGGLIPILVGTVVILGSLPLLTLIWGARPSDVRDAWAFLRDGVTVGGIPISFQVVAVFVAVFGLVFAATRVLQSVLKSTVLPRTRLDTGAKNALHAGVGYVGFALAAIVGVSAAGVDLSSLAIVAGALSVGIGFGLQTIVSNFVSGIILLIERPIKEGDWIEVGGFSGYVRGIRVRSTEIETFDRATVIVPNTDLIAGSVLNRTHAGISGRLIVPVGVSYDSDPRQVERILLAIAEEHPLVLTDPPPAVIFMSFGADSLNFEIRCRLRDVNFMLTVHSDMNFEIVEQFRAAGISIPYAQREVRIKNFDNIAGVPAPRPAGDEPA